MLRLLRNAVMGSYANNSWERYIEEESAIDRGVEHIQLSDE